MLGYLIRRVTYGLVTIFAVSVLSFLIIQLPPGDYVTSYIAALEAQGDDVSVEEAQSLRAYFGLGEPPYIQYAKWMYQISQGNLGLSFQYRIPVTEVIGERMLLTTLLALGSVLFVWFTAIPIGIFHMPHIWTHCKKHVFFSDQYSCQDIRHFVIKIVDYPGRDISHTITILIT